MGANTRFGTALAGALLMFFLGYNLTMVTDTGLVPQRILGWFSSRVQPSRKTKVKVDPAAELLRRVLSDEKRDLCKQRYPQGLTMTPEQQTFVGSQRYFVVLTLRNNEEMLHHTLYELLNLIARLGPANVFVSIFENNSKDKTPQFLMFFQDMLKLAGVQHHLVSSLTWAKEVAAAAQAASAAAATAGTAGSAASSSSSVDGKKGRRLLEAEDGSDTAAQSGPGRPVIHGLEAVSSSESAENAENSSGEMEGLSEDQLANLLAVLEAAVIDAEDEDQAIEMLAQQSAVTAAASGGAVSSPFIYSSSNSSASSGRGRLLAEVDAKAGAATDGSSTAEAAGEHSMHNSLAMCRLLHSCWLVS